MKKKRKKFKLFDIETGLVLVINEETRWTEKHSETWMPEACNGNQDHDIIYLTIIPQARMGSESIAHVGMRKTSRNVTFEWILDITKSFS